MPTYEYECEACQHTFEEFQSMSDKPLKTCPACKKRKLVRLIGAGAGIIFKGSGFYETDYKRKEAPASEKKAESAGGSTSPSSDTAKPASSGSRADAGAAKSTEGGKREKSAS